MPPQPCNGAAHKHISPAHAHAHVEKAPGFGRQPPPFKGIRVIVAKCPHQAIAKWAKYSTPRVGGSVGTEVGGWVAPLFWHFGPPGGGGFFWVLGL